MREALMLALRRESPELEKELIEKRVEAAYERVNEYLLPATEYLNEVLDAKGLRALKQIEWAFHMALEHSARSGIGCTLERKLDLVDRPRHTLPKPKGEDLPAPPPPASAADQVLHVGIRS